MSEDYITNPPDPNRGSMPLPDESINRGDGLGSNVDKEQVKKHILPPHNAEEGSKDVDLEHSPGRDIDKDK